MVLSGKKYHQIIFACEQLSENATCVCMCCVYECVSVE